MSQTIVEEDEILLEVSIDKYAWVKRKCGACSAIILKLPNSTIVATASEFATDQIVNEAEYKGIVLCFDLLINQTRGRLIIYGDSNLVITQTHGKIDCKASILRLSWRQAWKNRGSWTPLVLLCKTLLESERVSAGE